MNLLILRQHYLNRKIKMGEAGKLGELKTVHLLIEQWYTTESEKVQHPSRVREFQDSIIPPSLPLSIAAPDPKWFLNSTMGHQFVVFAKVHNIP